MGFGDWGGSSIIIYSKKNHPRDVGLVANTQVVLVITLGKGGSYRQIILSNVLSCDWATAASGQEAQVAHQTYFSRLVQQCS